MTRQLTEAQVRMMFEAEDRARYKEGYSTGRGHKLLGLRLQVSVNAPSEAYRIGYRDGQLDTQTLIKE